MLKSVTFLLGALLLVSACATGPAELPRASAQAETVRVEMPVDPRDNGLNWSQLELIEALAGEYKARGHGPFVISYPQNAGNADAAIGAIADVRTALYGHGLSWRQISGGAYEASGHVQAPLIFTFTRYTALAPHCDGRWTDVRNTGAGRGWAGFGCATEQNLAAMVSDPRDLVTPRTFDDPDTERRQTVIDRWRRGEVTSSQRSAEESGTVSRAVD
ncbi:CpaD family pilus assembly protein [Glycocaulis sp.]|uniref:CpaD family pilus assembly protein n=1 Tax=Glycocaulis sp. TaxID=1969725 RepID=UPI0025C16F50|nr:CpaD family pilus assembly protein [Glycocaulis sp.]MCH8522681.1 CpaD family pilus assembly protein [Glycocaulis sp.]